MYRLVKAGEVLDEISLVFKSDAKFLSSEGLKGVELDDVMEREWVSELWYLLPEDGKNLNLFIQGAMAAIENCQANYNGFRFVEKDGESVKVPVKTPV